METKYEMSIYFKETNFGTFCLLEHDLISSFINNYGFWESHLYDLYSKLITPDSIILDGGANIGFHTVQFARLAYKGKVYAFEPQSLIHNILSTNILINGLSDIVQQYKLGLSDKEAIETFTSMENPGVTMNEYCVNWGGRGFTEKDGKEEAITTTIDSFNITKLDFIKLDIQGFEYKALVGGINTIKKNMPTIFIENYDGRCTDYQIEQERAPIDLLLNLGYKGYRMLIGNNDDCIFTVNTKVISLIENNNIKFEIIK
jgi:FkbM family methyltransferase